MKKLWPVSIVLLCALLLFSACETPNMPDLPDSEQDVPEQPEQPDEIETIFEAFGDEPYHIYYTSYGNGACRVSDITTNPNNTEDYTLVIPERSPDGDLVIAIEPYIIPLEPRMPYAPENLPLILTEETYLAILQALEETLGPVHDVARFQSFYQLQDLTLAKSQKSRDTMLARFPLTGWLVLYNLDPMTTAEEELWLSEILDRISFTVEDRNREYTAIKRMAEKKFKGQELYSALRDIYYRGSEHMIGVELPTSMLKFDEWFFARCTDLINAPTLRNQSLIDGTTGLKYIVNDDGLTCTVIGCLNSAEMLYIPSNIGEYTVTAIGDYAFMYDTSIKELVIPATVISIGDAALWKCYGLETITYIGTETNWGAVTKGEEWDKSAGRYTLVFKDTVE